MNPLKIMPKEAWQAFFRAVDDIADGPGTDDEKSDAIEEMMNRCDCSSTHLQVLADLLQEIVE